MPPRSGRVPRCIVLAPTRELAKQVEREFQESSPGLKVGCFYGGKTCPALAFLPSCCLLLRAVPHFLFLEGSHREVHLVGRHVHVLTGMLGGWAGVDIGQQIRQLRAGVDVAVGTPGRFIDLINRGNLDLSMVRTPPLTRAPWGIS